jgi:hydroxymethylpyrimidine/phosphomethylpyrimidine kinase
VALGIATQNIDRTYKSGFDGVALLGSIWTPINPYKILNYARKSPICIGIADPSGGAGILADCKTLNSTKFIWLSILQIRSKQKWVFWTRVDSIGFYYSFDRKTFDTYDIKAVKIGIVPSLYYLNVLITEIKKAFANNSKIVWDTVLKSSTIWFFFGHR